MPSYDWFQCPIVIPYYGGKYELSRQLVNYIPPHERYFEMFAGGLSMFFRKHKAKWNVLNDKDNDIINLYVCVIEELDRLSEILYWLPKSRTLFLNYREEIKEDRIDIPDPHRAAKYLYCLRHSFNKMINTPFSMQKDLKKKYKEELRYTREKIGGATIENLDFEELVDRYNPQKRDFWYLDPPYFVATERNDYYRQNFTIDDHSRLRESVQKINDEGARFMISYDHREEVKEMYNDFDIRTISMQYAGATKEHRHKERKEYIITNYDLPNQQIKLQLEGEDDV